MEQRREAIRAAFESAQNRMALTFDEFEQLTAHWHCEPVWVRGQIVGAVLTNGAEIHACIKPEGFKRWLTRPVLKQTLHRIVAQYGYAETTVTAGNAVGDSFVRRLGFEPVAWERGNVRYRYGH